MWPEAIDSVTFLILFEDVGHYALCSRGQSFQSNSADLWTVEDAASKSISALRQCLRDVYSLRRFVLICMLLKCYLTVKAGHARRRWSFLRGQSSQGTKVQTLL